MELQLSINNINLIYMHVVILIMSKISTLVRCEFQSLKFV